MRLLVTTIQGPNADVAGLMLDAVPAAMIALPRARCMTELCWPCCCYGRMHKVQRALRTQSLLMALHDQYSWLVTLICGLVWPDLEFRSPRIC
jgi:hypothetical protein